MEIPWQLLVFTAPSLIYLAVRKWRGEKWNQTFEKLGWRGCRPVYFVWSLGVLAILLGLAWLATRLTPPDVFQRPNIGASYYAGWTRGVSAFLLAWLREAIYVTLGEEIFFRGFLGGWLIRRFGFIVGNTVQTLAFLLPHLLLLLVGLDLWPFLIVTLVAGWLQGWLRHSSGSILPGWLSHSLANAFGALAAMK